MFYVQDALLGFSPISEIWSRGLFFESERPLCLNPVPCSGWRFSLSDSTCGVFRAELRFFLFVPTISHAELFGISIIVIVSRQYRQNLNNVEAKRGDMTMCLWSVLLSMNSLGSSNLFDDSSFLGDHQSDGTFLGIKYFIGRSRQYSLNALKIIKERRNNCAKMSTRNNACVLSQTGKAQDAIFPPRLSLTTSTKKA